MITQTTIFDFLEDSKQKWFFNEDGFIDVLVRIPTHIRTPFEVDKMTSHEYKEWSDYCLAIQAVKLGTWGEAKELFEKYRKNRQPIRVRVYKNSDFRPKDVIEEMG